jgi:hypothetical protein
MRQKVWKPVGGLRESPALARVAATKDVEKVDERCEIRTFFDRLPNGLSQAYLAK